MASDDVGSRPSRFMIIPNTKRHPNNMETDQLPISEVITGLPRPYRNTNPKLGAESQAASDDNWERAMLAIVCVLDRFFCCLQKRV